MTIQSTVLIGNGPNRANEKDILEVGNVEISWHSLLADLSKFAGIDIRNIDSKPLTLVFDEILLRSRKPNVKLALLKEVSNKIFLARNAELTKRLSELTKVMLTTNYSWATFDSPEFGLFLHKKFPEINENTFSIFRGFKGDKREIWFINGSSDTPTSLALGYMQYARHQTQIKNYLTGGVSYSKIKIPNSPLYRGIPQFDFDKKKEPYSWVDLFLRDHIHMIGLGMEYTETILWWLLIEKMHLQRKYPKYIGGVTYHQVDVKGKPEKNINDKLNMLEDLGVQVNRVSAPSYFDGYMMIADQISPKVRKAKK